MHLSGIAGGGRPFLLFFLLTSFLLGRGVAISSKTLVADASAVLSRLTGFHLMSCFFTVCLLTPSSQLPFVKEQVPFITPKSTRPAILSAAKVLSFRRRTELMKRVPTFCCRLQLGLVLNKRFFHGETLSINDRTVATYLPGLFGSAPFASPLGYGCLPNLHWMVVLGLLRCLRLLSVKFCHASGSTGVVASHSWLVSFSSAFRRPALSFLGAISLSGLRLGSPFLSGKTPSACWLRYR